MSHRDVAVVVYGLSENWLGGVNYYRNLLSVFDGAGETGLRLHVFTNDPGHFADMTLSPRVVVHCVPMLQHRTPEWFLRKIVARTTGRDWMLVRLLHRTGVRAIAFSHVPGARATGIRCLPWIPDFQSQRHPEYFQPEVVDIEKRRAQEWLNEGDGLIVSSQAAHDDAVALFGADPARLHVMRFAPRLDGDTLSSPALRDQVLARHGISRPYFFLPNQYWQHKNHAVVVAALRRLRDSGHPVPLVISTGKTFDPRKPTYFNDFEATVRAANLIDDYRALGVIDRQDMLVLLANSVAVINPSRFEGWSSSVEEAKAFGKRLVVSDIPVHQEQVAGRGNVDLFSVDDVDALANLLLRHAVTASTVVDHPPRPEPELYRQFQQQYIAMLQSLVQPTTATA
jgi:glycosyltransferase involved in cell wall biosynthesis